jgi:hypothetical protein
MSHVIEGLTCLRLESRIWILARNGSKDRTQLLDAPLFRHLSVEVNICYLPYTRTGSQIDDFG